MLMALIESIPNVSEGRRATVSNAGWLRPRAASRCAAARPFVGSVAQSLRLHDCGRPPGAGDCGHGAGRGCGSHIDLRRHQGDHPRVGAVDVVPFIPLDGTTMSDCVALARAVGPAIAGGWHFPSYLYEEAAPGEARRRLEDIRPGAIRRAGGEDGGARWAPDFGPPAPHPTAGATMVGARRALIVYNVNLATVGSASRNRLPRGPVQQRRLEYVKALACRSRTAASSRCR